MYTCIYTYIMVSSMSTANIINSSSSGSRNILNMSCVIRSISRSSSSSSNIARAGRADPPIYR